MTSVQRDIVTAASPGRGPISLAGVLPSPAHTIDYVPAMLADSELYVQLAAAMDDLFAPIAVGLDCLAAYLTPALAPEDFLGWLAGLVGVQPGVTTGRGDAATLRHEIAAAVCDHSVRGTAPALRRLAAWAAGVAQSEVSLQESGGVVVFADLSLASDDPPQLSSAAGSATAGITLRLPVDDDRDPEDVARLVSAAVERERPVHCELKVEVSR